MPSNLPFLAGLIDEPGMFGDNIGGTGGVLDRYGQIVRLGPETRNRQPRQAGNRDEEARERATE
jgi:hypothetical protein